MTNADHLNCDSETDEYSSPVFQEGVRLCARCCVMAFVRHRLAGSASTKFLDLELDWPKGLLLVARSGKSPEPVVWGYCIKY